MVWPFTSNATQQEEPKSTKNDDAAKAAAKKEISSPNRETRRRKLMDAINENCALESTALLECQDSWSLWNRMTLCQAFQSKYMDCLNSQRALLIQLGYGREGNSATDDELIKWHADELYQKRTREKMKEEQNK